MKHLSKINAKTYDISESVDYENNGKNFRDDITLIWEFRPYNEPTKLVGWYYGGYNYELTEKYIEKNEKLNTQRLKYLLFNALVKFADDEYEKDNVLDYLGMSEEELNELFNEFEKIEFVEY